MLKPIQIVTTVIFFDRPADEDGAKAVSFKSRSGHCSALGIAQNASRDYLSPAAQADYGNLARYIRSFESWSWSDAAEVVASFGLEE